MKSTIRFFVAILALSFVSLPVLAQEAQDTGPERSGTAAGRVIGGVVGGLVGGEQVSPPSPRQQTDDPRAQDFPPPRPPMPIYAMPPYYVGPVNAGWFPFGAPVLQQGQAPYYSSPYYSSPYSPFPPYAASGGGAPMGSPNLGPWGRKQRLANKQRLAGPLRWTAPLEKQWAPAQRAIDSPVALAFKQAPIGSAGGQHAPAPSSRESAPASGSSNGGGAAANNGLPVAMSNPDPAATDNSDPAGGMAAPGKPAARPSDEAPSSSWDANALTVGGLILLYGVFITAVSTWLLSRGRNSDEVLRLMAVISAVIVSAFLLVVGYDDKQITPVIGLLGTIVGYLLGKEQGVQVGARQAAPDSAAQTRPQE